MHIHTKMKDILTAIKCIQDASEVDKLKFSKEIGIKLSKLTSLDLVHIKQKNAQKVFDFFINAWNNQNIAKAIKYGEQLLKQIAPVQNDSPFAVGDKVAVIRYEHGWHDGNLTAIITEVHKSNQGIFSYVAETKEGNAITIEHTRDAIKIG